MMKNEAMRDGQIASIPVDELYASLSCAKKKAALEKDIRHLYGRITGRMLKGDTVRREYEM